MQSPKSPQLPKIMKTLPCLKCAANTDQQLVPSNTGCSWQCQVCKHATHAFTHVQMMELVMRDVFKIPDKPKACAVPQGFKVYMEHFGPDADEKEVGGVAVKLHASITGKLPIVGKPMFTRPEGATHPGLAVPFGMVTRVEQC